MNLPLPQFPDGRVLTHSAEQCFKACPRRFYLAYRLGLKPFYDSDALRLGSAFHIGLEAIKRGGNADSGELAVRDEYKDHDQPPYLTAEEYAVEQETAVALVRGYWNRWHNDTILNFVAVELSFDLPIIDPANGRKARLIRNRGKIDGIAELPDGRLAIIEHKTCGEDIDPAADYWKRLMMDAQISRYVLAARAMGYDIQTTIYDVVRKPQIRPKNIAKAERAVAASEGYYYGCKLTGPIPERETPELYAARLIDDLAKRPEHYFARCEVPRLNDDLEQFAHEQWQVLQTIREADRHGRYYRNTAACLSPYKCQFFDVCRGLRGNPDEAVPDGFRRVAVLHEELKATA